MKTTSIEQLLTTMAALRDPDNGCPWDLKQNHQSLIPYLLEETYEVVEALENGDDSALCEELGDLLMQIVFHAQIAQEEARFDFTDVAAAIDAKLIRRHPHVFGDSTLQDEAELDAAWEQSKAAEKPAKHDSSLLDGVIAALPALMRAQKLQRRAARVGFDWPDHQGPLAKIHEETREIETELNHDSLDQQRLREEIGDLLFSVVNLARHFDIDAEDALRQANNKFSLRFRAVEQCLAETGGNIHDANTEQMEQCWEKAKRRQA